MSLRKACVMKSKLVGENQPEVPPPGALRKDKDLHLLRRAMAWNFQRKGTLGKSTLSLVLPLPIKILGITKYAIALEKNRFLIRFPPLNCITPTLNSKYLALTEEAKSRLEEVVEVRNQSYISCKAKLLNFNSVTKSGVNRYRKKTGETQLV